LWILIKFLQFFISSSRDSQTELKSSCKDSNILIGILLHKNIYRGRFPLDSEVKFIRYVSEQALKSSVSFYPSSHFLLLKDPLFRTLFTWTEKFWSQAKFICLKIFTLSSLDIKLFERRAIFKHCIKVKNLCMC
jgi:hypothetical protein